MMYCKRVVFLVVSFVLVSCAVGPNYTRPIPPSVKTYTPSQTSTKTVATPTKFGNAQRFVSTKDIPAQWWKLFHSKPLNELIMTSFHQSPSVGVAQAALHSALESVYAQQGSLYPYVGLSFLPSKQQTARLLTSVLASNQYNYSLYTGQLYVSYTPDVFGGTRRQIEALIAQAELQRLQLEATYLTLASNVVNAAIQEASLREQIKANHEIIVSQRKILDVMHKQKQFGDVSTADIAMQEAALAVSESAVLPLEKQLVLQRNLLNALVGRFPDDKCTPTFTFNSLHIPKDLPISLPSTLIEHRPDIRAAQEQMHAANALIGVAVSNRLPNVTIGFTNAGTASTSLSTLFQPDSLFWGLAGIITHPLFDAGTLLHRQRFAQEIYKQAVAQYRLTVINAFQNVADTLKSIRLDAIALHAAHQAERAAWRSLSITRQQQQAGDISNLIVLISEQAYQQARLNLIQAQARRLSDTVALFQALGGGWWNKAYVKGCRV